MKFEIDEYALKFDATSVITSNKIKFIGVDGFDVYNITKPFKNDGKVIIAGRVEKRDSELSKIMFFEQVSDFEYTLCSLPTFDLQDPYFCFIEDELVLGGTEVFDHPTIEGALWYRAVKFRGKDVSSLKRFFEGPNGMKDIRLLELHDGRILVFTRPQGDIGGRGQIGRVIIDNLDDLSIDVINSAPLFNCFVDENWGGVNEALLLTDNLVGVLGHIAKFGELGNRHYYGCTFIYDISEDSLKECKIVVKRECLESGESKRSDLEDVIFSGGLVIDGDEVDVYVGAGDCEGHVVRVKNPFKGCDQ